MIWLSKGPANLVPAAAVIREVRVLKIITGLKGFVGGEINFLEKLQGTTLSLIKTKFHLSTFKVDRTHHKRLKSV